MSGALELFAAWLSRREGGQATAFEELLRDHPGLARELEDLHASWKRMAAAGEPSADAAPPNDEVAVEAPSVRISRLSSRGGSFERYRLEGEVARGGMGAILRVWDEDLRRHLAMKVALDGQSRGQAKALARFLEEAQVTGQLDHPGIVPVHELGLDSSGRLYFTMKLVEGRDLKRIFALVFAGEDGWNETRALGVILKVCEAMAYAHKKGVVHRDLKPGNVMVGSFGEVFVMDWGLARSLRRADTHDLRLAPEAGPEPIQGGEDDSLLLTRDGDVLGTPAYMPPEQARGEVESLSARSDVYSIGAMLYHLLARRMPYVSAGDRPAHRELLARVRAGPPAPLHELNADVPAELAAICEKAMARDAEKRYADTLAFAEDLRAYLEGRVVAAYETGAVAELRKWIARNRALAAACAAAIAILAGGLVVSSSLFVKAKAETARADEKAIESEQRAADVLSLSAMQDLQDLVARADSLWPARPENVPAFEEWLRDAGVLIEGRAADASREIEAKPGLADHRAKLAELEARALPLGDPGESAAPPRFERGDDRWWHAQLSKLVADLEAFSSGLFSAGTDPEHGWGVAKRLAMANEIPEASVAGPAASKLWAEAIASIRDPAQCPAYGGLEIAPQYALLPAGRDPGSGLFEFAHLETGEPPRRGADGTITPHEGMGLVFVLIPGGTFRMGAQARDPAEENFDPMTLANESPVNEVVLDPFFLSKYEMTQDQWLRFVGRNPSTYAVGTGFGSKATTLLHPVEGVSPRTAARILARLDLLLPTEAQWEYAARAGTTTPWSTGAERESLVGAANLRDLAFSAHAGSAGNSHDAWLDDAYAVHAPIGTYRANGFGLHDVHGNAFEACRDSIGSYEVEARPGDGERYGPKKSVPIRGGSFFHPHGRARSAARLDVTLDYSDFNVGLRPARPIQP